MKAVFTTMFLFIRAISQAGVINKHTISIDKANIFRGFESYNSEMNKAPDFLSSLIMNMFQQPRISSRNYRNVKVFSRRANPEFVPNCEHYIMPNLCPICIFRMRKSVNLNDDKGVPDFLKLTFNANVSNSNESTTVTSATALSSNTSESSKYDTFRKITARDISKITLPFLIDDMRKTSNIYKINRSVVGEFKETASSINEENNTYKNTSVPIYTSMNNVTPSKNRMQVYNIKNLEDPSKNLDLPDIFQKFEKSWRNGRELNNESARFFISKDPEYSLEKFSKAVENDDDDDDNQTTFGVDVEESITFFIGLNSTEKVHNDNLKLFLSISLPLISGLGAVILWFCYMIRLNSFICNLFSVPPNEEDSDVDISLKSDLES